MSPETAIERVGSFIRRNSEKFECLDALHEAVANPLGWRRGAEIWLPSSAWHLIFENYEDAGLFAAQALRDNGLLRTQTGPSLQCGQAVLLRQREHEIPVRVEAIAHFAAKVTVKTSKIKVIQGDPAS